MMTSNSLKKKIPFERISEKESSSEESSDGRIEEYYDISSIYRTNTQPENEYNTVESIISGFDPRQSPI